MEAFTTLTSHAAVLPGDDIDTDVIFPARFLLITAKAGLGRYAFYEKRYDHGAERPGFPLSQEPAKSARILITGANFGCGSSREQAVWALHDLGIRCLIASSFGEIFHSNCYKSAVLPVILPEETVEDLRQAAARGADLTIDLLGKRILADNRAIPFEVEDWRRDALIKGWDEVLTLLNTQADAISAFEQTRRAEAPWLFAAS